MRKLLIFLVLAACAPPLDSVVMDPRPVPQTRAEIAFVTAVFNEIQPRSIAEAREYCGVIGVTQSGAYRATPPRAGRRASCLPPTPNWPDARIIASYHTHGNTDPRYFNEVPSFDDMRTDIEANTDGYVATPGGRLWYVDARARLARQLCGLNCLISDPAYRDDPDLTVQPTYTLQQLSGF
ncbi:DUF4329 domain-containing protein [uncultured Tateyamaria sp.]|uniref:DUF4329 domain-containing protein n=1 Tax=Tateyamaria sp. TaxID=1929288 RepID=UPI00260DE8E3|nr:DUF4329 domain-containing protein [uncultured Tateyamaria sp.]